MIKIIVTGGAGFIGSHKVYITPETRPQRFDFSGFARTLARWSLIQSPCYICIDSNFISKLYKVSIILTNFIKFDNISTYGYQAKT